MSDDGGVEMDSSMISLSGSVLGSDDEVFDDAELRAASELTLAMSVGGRRLATSD